MEATIPESGKWWTPAGIQRSFKRARWRRDMELRLAEVGLRLHEGELEDARANQRFAEEASSDNLRAALKLHTRLAEVTAAADLAVAELIRAAADDGASVPQDLQAWANFLLAGVTRNGYPTERIRAYVRVSKGEASGTKGNDTKKGGA